MTTEPTYTLVRSSAELSVDAAQRVLKASWRRRSKAKEAAHVEAWNAAHPVGTLVFRVDDLGGVHETKTTTPAWLVGGHTAMVTVAGISGGYTLTRIVLRAAPVAEVSAGTCKAWCGAIDFSAAGLGVETFVGPTAAPLRSMSIYCTEACREARRQLHPVRPAPPPASLEPEWDAFVAARDAMVALLERNGAPRASIVNLLNLDPPAPPPGDAVASREVVHEAMRPFYVGGTTGCGTSKHGTMCDMATAAYARGVADGAKPTAGADVRDAVIATVCLGDWKGLDAAQKADGLGEPCVGCGKRSRLMTAACDHCDYEDK